MTKKRKTISDNKSLRENLSSLHQSLIKKFTKRKSKLKFIIKSPDTTGIETSTSPNKSFSNSPNLMCSVSLNKSIFAVTKTPKRLFHQTTPVKDYTTVLEKGNIRCTLNILPNNADTRRYTHYLYSNLSSKTFHGLIRPNYEPLPSLHHAIAKMRNIIEQQRKCGYTTVTTPMYIDNDDNNISNTVSVKTNGVLCNTIQRSIRSMRGGTDPVIQCITNPDAFYSLLKKLNYNYRKLPPAEAIVSNALQAINVLNAIYNKINRNTANTNVLHINSDYLESHTFFELSALFYNLIPHSHSPFSSIHNICIDSVKQKIRLL